MLNIKILTLCNLVEFNTYNAIKNTFRTFLSNQTFIFVGFLVTFVALFSEFKNLQFDVDNKMEAQTDTLHTPSELYRDIRIQDTAVALIPRADSLACQWHRKHRGISVAVRIETSGMNIIESRSHSNVRLGGITLSIPGLSNHLRDGRQRIILRMYAPQVDSTALFVVPNPLYGVAPPKNDTTARANASTSSVPLLWVLGIGLVLLLSVAIGTWYFFRRAQGLSSRGVQTKNDPGRSEALSPSSTPEPEDSGFSTSEPKATPSPERVQSGDVEASATLTSLPVERRHETSSSSGRCYPTRMSLADSLKTLHRRASCSESDAIASADLLLPDPWLQTAQEELVRWLLHRIDPDIDRQTCSIPRRMRAHLRMISAPKALRRFFRDLNLDVDLLVEAIPPGSLPPLFERLSDVDDAAAGTPLSDTPLYAALAEGNVVQFERRLDRLQIAARAYRHLQALDPSIPEFEDVRTTGMRALSEGWTLLSKPTLKEWERRSRGWYAAHRRLEDVSQHLDSVLHQLKTHVLQVRLGRQQAPCQENVINVRVESLQDEEALPADDTSPAVAVNDASDAVGEGFITKHLITNLDALHELIVQELRTLAPSTKGSFSIGDALRELSLIADDASYLLNAIRPRRSPPFPDTVEAPRVVDILQRAPVYSLSQHVSPSDVADALARALDVLHLQYSDDLDRRTLRRAFRHRARHCSPPDPGDPGYQDVMYAFLAVRAWIQPSEATASNFFPLSRHDS